MYGRKRSLLGMRTLNQSHAIALMMYNQTDRKGKEGSTVTGITELSHDLLFHRRVLGAFTVAVPELCLGPVVR